MKRVSPKNRLIDYLMILHLSERNKTHQWDDLHFILVFLFNSSVFRCFTHLSFFLFDEKANSRDVGWPLQSAKKCLDKLLNLDQLRRLM